MPTWPATVLAGPWKFGEESEGVIRSYINARYKLMPSLIAAGQHDSPAFRAQSKAFCETLEAHTEVRATYVELAGEDHFTAMERMAEEGYALTETVMAALRR